MTLLVERWKKNSANQDIFNLSDIDRNMKTLLRSIFFSNRNIQEMLDMSIGIFEDHKILLFNPLLWTCSE